jgi:alkaline phosphatase
MLAVDGLPYSTLSYANGPGPNTHHSNGSRVNMTNDNFNSVTYRVRSPVPLYIETHGGDDVNSRNMISLKHVFSNCYYNF